MRKPLGCYLFNRCFCEKARYILVIIGQFCPNMFRGLLMVVNLSPKLVFDGLMCGVGLFFFV